MNEKLGKYFLKNGELYKCISYCEKPTITFEKVVAPIIPGITLGQQRETMAVGSPLFKEFKELYTKEELKEIISKEVK